MAVLLVIVIGLGGVPAASAGSNGGAPGTLGITPIRVDNGTSVTIWERTTDMNVLTYSVATLIGPGGTFDSLASEHYMFTSDGAHLKIHCFRPTFGNGTSTGNNIAAVRLEGVPGYPGGLWASGIVSYLVGYGGIASSRFAALGDNLSDITYMGDQDSELVLEFAVEAPDYAVTVDTVPAGLQVSVDGSVVSAPFVFWCAAGSSHVVEAPSPQGTQATRYVFTSWSDGGSRSHAVACVANETYTAYFATQYRVVVHAQPVGLGVVVDGTTYNETYTGWWNRSEPHILDAPSPQPMGPQVRWSWQSWSDGGARRHTVSVEAPVTFIAPFVTEYRVTVATSPAGMRVVVDGVEIEAPGTFWWAMESSHTLSALETQEWNGADYRMESWSDGGDLRHVVVTIRPGVYTAVYRQAPPPVSMNWKPFVAAAFSVVLLLLGLVRSWRRPYPFPGLTHRSLKTLLLFSLPFVAAEAGTGILSLALGILAIPPLIGWGTVVDVSILVMGLVAISIPKGSERLAGTPART